MFRLNSEYLHNFVQTRLQILYGKTYLRLSRMTCEIVMKITRYTHLETLQQLVMDCQTNSSARCRPKPIEPSRVIRNRWSHRLSHGAASLQSEMVPVGPTDLNASDCRVKASVGSELLGSARLPS